MSTSTPATVILLPEVEDREPRMASRRRKFKRLWTGFSAVFTVKRLTRHAAYITGLARSEHTEPRDLQLEGGQPRATGRQPTPLLVVELSVEVDAEPHWEVALHDIHLHNSSLPIMRLPVEILTKMFHLVHSPNIRMPPRVPVTTIHWRWHILHRWLPLRLVCKHWHNVVARDPSLWADIHLQDQFPAVEPSPAIFLARSEQVPLKVYLGHSNSFPYARHNLNVDDVLEQLPRVQELAMSPLCKFWHIIVDVITYTKMPMLRSLAFTAGYEHIAEQRCVRLSGHGLPALRSLSIAHHLAIKLDNFRNLKQLDLRDTDHWQGFSHFSFDLFSAMEHFEDLKLSYICITDPPEVTPPPDCRPFLPKLKRLVLNKTNAAFNTQLLARLSPLTGIFLILAGLDQYRESPSGAVSLTLQSKTVEKLLPLMNAVFIRFRYRSYDTKVSFRTVAGLSLGLRCDFRVLHDSSESPYTLPLHTQAQELWIDRWGSDGTLWNTSRSLVDDRNELVRLHCGGADLQCSRLFCHGDAYDGWLNGLTPNKEVSTPAPLLRELHILTPPPADPKSLAKMAKMLEARRAAGIPLDTLCFYLPLTGFADHELATWKEAFGQWGAWGARTPGRLVARGSLKVVFVCTETLPRMRVPAFCTEPSAGLWKWPTMWDAY